MPKTTRWYEKPAVLDYIIESYAGTEPTAHGSKRQFIWEESNGDVVIGNSRAFTDHLAAKFNLNIGTTSWAAVHEVLRMLGEVVQVHAPRTRVRGQKFHNQQPEVRVLKRRQRP